MMIKHALLGVVLATAAIFSVASVSTGDLLAAGVSAALGVIWLLQELGGESPFSSLYFVAYVGLAAFASLNHASLPLLLLGLCADLAAWDLSRFRQRLKDEADSDEKTFLETNHLQKLAAVSAVGFVIALVPLLVQISLNFVILLVIMLLLLILLRQSILSLRRNTND